MHVACRQANAKGAAMGMSSTYWNIIIPSEMDVSADNVFIP